MSGRVDGSWRVLGDSPYNTQLWTSDWQAPIPHSSATTKLVNSSMSKEGIVQLQEFHVVSHKLFYLK